MNTPTTKRPSYYTSYEGGVWHSWPTVTPLNVEELPKNGIKEAHIYIVGTHKYRFYVHSILFGRQDDPDAYVWDATLGWTTLLVQSNKEPVDYSKGQELPA